LVSKRGGRKGLEKGTGGKSSFDDLQLTHMLVEVSPVSYIQLEIYTVFRLAL
jgi:hypothetical protein